MFSIPRAGTRIPSHHGLDNLSLTFHLGLRVPAGCRLRVESEVLAWRQGEVLAFDDSYRHEAWNEGTEDRAVLLVDLWHPGLAREEIAGLQRTLPTLRRLDARRGSWPGGADA